MIKVQGLAELDKALGELTKGTARGVLRRAGLQALEVFVDVVKDIAPIDAAGDTPERPAGRYRDSWMTGTKLNRSQSRQAHREGKSFAEVYAGTTDPVLGTELEFGTAERTRTESGGSTGAVPPHPHARPAWQVTQGEVLSRLKTLLGIEIDKAAARAARRRRRS
jgi:hypothetical protein